MSLVLFLIACSALLKIFAPSCGRIFGLIILCDEFVRVEDNLFIYIFTMRSILQTSLLPRMNRTSTRLFSTPIVRSTTASGSQVYESKRAVYEYLLFHYGDTNDPNIQFPYDLGPLDASDFTVRTSLLCSSFKNSIDTAPSRALDVGCSVGGSTFELTRYYDEVVGIDFSQHFIDAANELKVNGVMDYEVLKQGKIYTKCTAEVSDSAKRWKAKFIQGDACNLSPSLGTFDVIHASNLMCRLPSPRKFLSSVPKFLNKNGILVLVSPYSWLEEYTDVNEWVGVNTEDSFIILKDYLEKECHMKLIHQENVPFLIREHERKFQYGVSDATIWRKS